MLRQLKRLAGLLGLGPRREGFTQTRGIRVPMDDGVTLETDLYQPDGPGPHPTLLTRVPYGIAAFRPVAERYAAHGFIVVMQATRGTSRSGGTFEPLVDERRDGLATLRWLRQQPWFDGRLGVSGPSYLGYAAWAIADAPEIVAMSAKSTAADFRPIVFPGGAFHLGLWLSWVQVIEALRGSPLLFALSVRFGGVEKKTLRAASALPLIDADIKATGHKVTFWRHWLGNAIGNDAFWEKLDHRHLLGQRTPPNLFVSGWSDFMLDPMLRDYETLRSAGRRPYLTIGPWAHTDPAMLATGFTETLEWMEVHLMGKGTLRGKPVRIEVSGAWHEFESWPPANAEEQLWHLHPERGLSTQPAVRGEPDQYRYNPADPTPNLGGAFFGFSGTGQVDQASLEARPDVLTYTSEPLVNDFTIIGPPQVTLFARASLPTADFFVKLCDVDDAGVSTNVTDGILRVSADAAAVHDNIWRLEFQLHATAHRFPRGHRLRVQVSSGAHPRYARNTGTDEPLREARTLLAADIEIFHDAAHPSALALPVVELNDER